MLQRWQSLWMLLVILSSFALFMFSAKFIFFSRNIVDAFCIMVVLVDFVSVFSYKKRKTQVFLNNICIIINVLLIGLLSFYLLNLSGGSDFPKKGIGLLAFPVISIFGLVIANRLIKRDEELVKSVDRFR